MSDRVVVDQLERIANGASGSGKEGEMGIHLGREHKEVRVGSSPSLSVLVFNEYSLRTHISCPTLSSALRG